MIERLPIPSREEWLRTRRAYVGASEVAALFGASPYLTPFQLYADKAGLSASGGPDSDVLRRGRWLEPAVALAAGDERPAWKIEKAAEYLCAPEWGLGATPDFWVLCPERGPGVLQAKTVAKPEFAEKWQDGPPLWIVLQTLQEMMLSGVSWGAIGALVISSYTVECVVYEFERHSRAEARLIEKAASFWNDVRAGRQPKPDYSRDDEVIRALYPRDNGEIIDLTGDSRLPELLAQHETLTTRKSGAEKQLKAVNAEIAAKLGAALAAICGDFEIRYPTIERKGYTVAATSYRRLSINRNGDGRNA